MRWPLIAVLVVSCGDDTAFFRLPLATEEERSMVLVGDLDDRLVGFATPLPPEGPLVLQLGRAERAELGAVLYHEPLASLGIDAGYLERDPSGAPLPEGRTLVASIAGGAATEWAETEERPGLLERFLVRRHLEPLECPTISADTVSLPTDRPIDALVPLGSQRVLVGSRDERWFVSTPTTATEVDALTSAVADGTAGCCVGWSAPDGRILVSGSGAGLAEIDPNGFQVESLVPVDPGADPVIDLDGGRREAGGLEVYAVTRDGALLRWLEGSGGWERFALPYASEKARVVWTGAGRAVVADGRGVFVRFLGGRLEEDSGFRCEMITAAAYADDAGLVLGGTVCEPGTGLFFEQDGRTEGVFMDVLPDLRVNDLMLVEGAVFLALDGGRVAAVVDRRSCGRTRLADVNLARLAFTGDRRAAMTPTFGDPSGTPVYWISW